MLKDAVRMNGHMVEYEMYTNVKCTLDTQQAKLTHVVQQHHQQQQSQLTASSSPQESRRIQPTTPNRPLMPLERSNPIPALCIPHHGTLVMTRRYEKGTRFIVSVGIVVDGTELEFGERAGVAWADYGDLTTFGGGGWFGGGCHCRLEREG